MVMIFASFANIFCVFRYLVFSA